MNISRPPLSHLQITTLEMLNGEKLFQPLPAIIAQFDELMKLGLIEIWPTTQINDYGIAWLEHHHRRIN